LNKLCIGSPSRTGSSIKRLTSSECLGNPSLGVFLGQFPTLLVLRKMRAAAQKPYDEAGHVAIAKTARRSKNTSEKPVVHRDPFSHRRAKYSVRVATATLQRPMWK